MCKNIEAALHFKQIIEKNLKRKTVSSICGKSSNHWKNFFRKIFCHHGSLNLQCRRCHYGLSKADNVAGEIKSLISFNK